MASDWAVVAAAVGSGAVTTAIPAWITFRRDSAQRKADREAAAAEATANERRAMAQLRLEVLDAAAAITSWDGGLAAGGQRHADLVGELTRCLQRLHVAETNPAIVKIVDDWIGAGYRGTGERAGELRAAMRAEA